MSLARKIVGAAVRDAAGAIAAEEASKRKQDPHWYWFTRGLILLTLLAGWLFILWQNKFHIDPPAVVVMLAYFAVVMTVTNLWRVGAAVVARESSDDSWGRPLGERGELEKEKRTLLKAIKEAEFDQAMGKLSKPDAEQLIQMYRARAIEVIKELDRLDAGHADTPREKIEREVAARLLIEQQKADAKKKRKADGKKADGKSDKTDATAEATDSKKTDSKKTEAKTTSEDETEAKSEAKTDAAATDDEANAKPDKADNTDDSAAAPAGAVEPAEAKAADTTEASS